MTTALPESWSAAGAILLATGSMSVPPLHLWAPLAGVGLQEALREIHRAVRVHGDHVPEEEAVVLLVPWV